MPVVGEAVMIYLLFLSLLLVLASMYCVKFFMLFVGATFDVVGTVL